MADTLTPETAAAITARGAASPAVQEAIAAVTAAVQRLADAYAAEQPQTYPGTASFTVEIDRVDDAPERLVYLSDAAARRAGYPPRR